MGIFTEQLLEFIFHDSLLCNHRAKIQIMKHHPLQAAKHANLQHYARRNLLKFRQGNQHWQKSWQKKIFCHFSSKWPFHHLNDVMIPIHLSLSQILSFLPCKIAVPRGLERIRLKNVGVRPGIVKSGFHPPCWEVKQIGVIRWNECPKNVRCIGRPWFFMFFSLCTHFWPKALSLNWKSESISRCWYSWYSPHAQEIFFVDGVTLPEINIAPENRPSQKESSLPTIHVLVLCFREGSGTMMVSSSWIPIPRPATLSWNGSRMEHGKAS